MKTFRIKAYAKINLGLDVLRRRPDGYHEVKMIMQTVDLYDDLEFTKLAEDEIRIFTDKEEALNVIEKAILLYREQGQPGERFANMIERIGFENVEQQLMGNELLERKAEILGE